MRKIVLGVMAAIISLSSIAQPKNRSQENKEFHKGGKHFKGHDRYEQLNLSGDQKAQVKVLNESFKQQMQDLRKNGNMSTEDQKAKRMSLAKEHQQKISEILTPEQREKAKKLKRDFKEERKDDREDGAKGKKFDKVSKDLHLSQDQSNQMAVLNQSFKNDIKSIKENSALSKDEKKAQIKALQQKHKTDIKALLTGDQKKQLKSKHKNTPHPNAVK